MSEKLIVSTLANPGSLTVGNRRLPGRDFLGLSALVL
jgi:hypothetical protein